MLEISTKTGRKIVLLAILSALAITAFGLYFEYHYMKVTTSSQEEEMQRIMSFALNSIAPIRHDYSRGMLSGEEAEEKIAERLGFFTLDNHSGSSIMFMGNLDGTVISKPDSAILNINRETAARFAAAGRKGSGFLTYSKRDPENGKEKTETVYIVGLAELNSYIGIGDYSSAVLKITEMLKPRLILFFFLFIAALSLMNYIIVVPILNSVRYITGKIYSINTGAEIGSLFDDKPKFSKNSDEETIIKKFEELITSIHKKSDRTIHALKEKNRSIEHTLTEKEIMLKEINHRVKNNLQVIISLLRIQLTQHQDPAIRDPFLQTITRLEAISMIHSMLYKDNYYSGIRAGKYINDLTSFIISGFGAENSISIRLDVDETELSIEQAVSIGIIVNEAVTNSIKYAFQQSDNGLIKISIRKDGDVRFFCISDNGCGLPDDTLEGSSGGLGINLIKNLSRQLKGELEISNVGGTAYRIKFS